MKKDNEAKMKEILNELEDELIEEKKEDKEEDIDKEDKIEETVDESVEDEIDESENVEEESNDESEEDAEETIEIEEAEKEEDDLKEVKESPIRQVGIYLIEKLKKYKYILILDFAIFLFLFFVIPMIILEVKPVIWMTLFLIFTILPTVAFYLKNLFKKYQIMLGIPFFYLCILCILDSCTIKDLYGITSHGALDKSPAWIDAILVTFIIVFFQYVGLTVMDIAKKYLNNRKKK